MRDDIDDIQDELDEVFPGCKLQYVPLWGYWVITDWITAPDGSPATACWYPTPWNLLQLEEGDFTNRKIVFLLSHPDTAEPIHPSCENIISTMYRAYTGGTAAAYDAWLDRIEAGEDLEKLKAEQMSREMSRQAASTAWDRHQGKVISTAAGTTNMANTDRFIGQQIMQQNQNDMVAHEMVTKRAQVRQGAARDGQLMGV